MAVLGPVAGSSVVDVDAVGSGEPDGGGVDGGGDVGSSVAGAPLAGGASGDGVLRGASEGQLGNLGHDHVPGNDGGTAPGLAGDQVGRGPVVGGAVVGAAVVGGSVVGGGGSVVVDDGGGGSEVVGGSVVPIGSPSAAAGPTGASIRAAENANATPALPARTAAGARRDAVRHSVRAAPRSAHREGPDRRDRRSHQGGGPTGEPDRLTQPRATR